MKMQQMKFINQTAKAYSENLNTNEDLLEALIVRILDETSVDGRLNRINYLLKVISERVGA